MNSSLVKKVANYFAENPEDCIGEVEKDEIKDAEENLGISFSEGYKNFISKYSAAGINTYFIHGFRQIPLMGNNWSVVDKTYFYKNKQEWPGISDWYVISDDGRGNPIGCKPDGSVWLSDHDAGFEQVKLADSFEEFLEKLLDDRLYE